MSKALYDSAECYRRFLEGDEQAAARIMDEFFFGLVYYIDCYLHDVHSAEDIAMDVMAELFSRRRKYDSRSSLKTYLYMLGRSRALDRLRHTKRIVFSPLSEASETPDEQACLEEKVLSEERARVVRDAVSALPEEMREAVHLVYFEELSYEEAAAVMKRSRKQVDNLLYRAKKELRSALGEEGKDLL